MVSNGEDYHLMRRKKIRSQPTKKLKKKINNISNRNKDGRQLKGRSKKNQTQTNLNLDIIFEYDFKKLNIFLHHNFYVDYKKLHYYYYSYLVIIDYY